MILLLKEHEKCSTEVKEHRATINELNFLLKQVQREIKGLRAKGVGFEKVCTVTDQLRGVNFDVFNVFQVSPVSTQDYAITLTNQTLSSQLENRLNTAMKKFNSVNSDNFNMRIEIDRLLRDRWKNKHNNQYLNLNKTNVLRITTITLFYYFRPNTLPPRLPAIAFAAKQPKLRVYVV